MDKMLLLVDERNGDGNTLKREQTMEFTGEKIASFKIPHDGDGRKGSIGTDFILYRTAEANFLLFVEHWSLRPGGENSRKFEIYSSLEEMRGSALYEDGHQTMIPEQIINRAEKMLLEINSGINGQRQKAKGNSAT